MYVSKSCQILKNLTLNYQSKVILNNLITVLNHPRFIKVNYNFGGWTTLKYPFWFNLSIQYFCPKAHIRERLQLNEYETAPNFIQLSQKLTLECLLIQLNFPVFTQFLHDLIIKLFCFDLQNNFMIRSCWYKTGKFS